jgi:hypothetical protein
MKLFREEAGHQRCRRLSQEGSLNNEGYAAPRGILTIFVTGCGQTSPMSATGVPARFPLPGPGVVQVNARIPLDVPVAAVPDRASVP